MGTQNNTTAKNTKKIFGLILIILFAFVFFCLISGILKPFSNMLYGVFGISAICLTVVGILTGILLVNNKSITLKAGYVINFLAMYVFIALLVHTITSAVFIDESGSFSDYIKICYNFADDSGLSAVTFGGVVFGAIVYPIYTNLTAIGTYFILAACLIVTIIVAARFFIKYSSAERDSLFVDKKVGKQNANDKSAVSEETSDEEDEEYIIPAVDESTENDLSENGFLSGTKRESEKSDFQSAFDALYGPTSNDNNVESVALDKGEDVYTQKPVFDTAPVAYPATENTDDALPYQSPSEAAIKIRPNHADVNPTPILNAEYYARQKEQAEKRKSGIIPQEDYVTSNNVNKNQGAVRENDDVFMEVDASEFNNDLQHDEVTMPKADDREEFGYVDEEPSFDNSKSELESPAFNKKPTADKPHSANKSPIVSSVEDFKAMRAEQTEKRQPSVVVKEVAEKEEARSKLTYERFIDNDNSDEIDTIEKNVPKEEKSSSDNVINKTDREVVDFVAKQPENSREDEQSDKLIVYKPYVAPGINLLDDTPMSISVSDEECEYNSKTLEETLAQYKIGAKVKNLVIGPTVTRYEMALDAGVSVKRLQQLTDDIGRSLAKSDAIIVPHIPGKNLVGIEVSNEKPTKVPLRVLIDSPEFKNAKGDLCMTVGIDLSGKKDIEDLATMPHLLVAGSSGSGKSVVINTMMLSLLYKYSPEEVRFILVDPKRVELKLYEGLPHLLMKNIIVEPDNAVAALKWLNEEMNRRYELLDEIGAKELSDYNRMIDPNKEQRMYRIVLIVDEFADLMSDTYKNDVEQYVNRLSRMARAAGIHLILATQRPSVAVLSGDIKNNFSCRMALRVASAVDAKTILGYGGPEKLLGKGDMMLKTEKNPEPIRLQGAYVSVEEISSIISFIKKNNESHFFTEIEKRIFSKDTPENGALNCGVEEQVDAEFLPALKYCIEKGEASISSIQSRFRLGWPKACRIMQDLEAKGYVAPSSGTKARTVLITMSEFKEKFGDNV